MKTLRVILLCLMTFALGSANAEEGRVWQGSYDAFAFEPVPKASGDASLDAVIKDMLAALEAHDWVRLSKHFSRQNDLAGELKEQWNVEEKSSLFWGAMHKALALGGHVYGGGNDPKRFYAPELNVPQDEINEQYPERDMPALDFITVTDSDVAVMARPDIASAIIERLSYVHIVYLGTTDEMTSSVDGLIYPWIKVMTPSGKDGYILGDQVFHFMNDCSVSFEFQEGEWVMSYFNNG